MRNFSFFETGLFAPALVLSVSFHALLIGGSGWLPSPPQLSVVRAPNTPEITVLHRPVVTIVEEEIVSDEIIEKEVFDEIVFNRRVVKPSSNEITKPSVSSRKSLGAVTKAKPLAQANPAPGYPRIARQKGWEGVVRLEVLVDEEGSPGKVSIKESSGYGALDASALKAVRNWKFLPARSGSLRFSSRITIPIQFTLVKEWQNY